MQVDGHLLRGSGRSFVSRVDDGIADLEAGIAIGRSHPPRRAPRQAGSGPAGRDPHGDVAPDLVGGAARHLPGALPTCGRVRGGARPSVLARLRTLPRRAAATLAAEPEPARELAARVVEFAAEHDLRIWRAGGTVILGASAVELGLGEDGLGWVDEGLERFRGLQTPPIFWPFLLMIRAAACARAGRSGRGSRSRSTRPTRWQRSCRTAHRRAATCSARGSRGRGCGGVRGGHRGRARLGRGDAGAACRRPRLQRGPARRSAIEERRARVREVLVAVQRRPRHARAGRGARSSRRDGRGHGALSATRSREQTQGALSKFSQR